MESLWVNILAGIVTTGPALSADLSDLQVRAQACQIMDKGLMRIRWAGSILFFEFTCESEAALAAARAWLIAQGAGIPAGMTTCFRNLRSGVAWDTCAQQIVNPEPAPKHQQRLSRKGDHAYQIRDLCDASTPEELHLAAYWYAMRRFGVDRERSKALFLGPPECRIGTKHLRWTARRLEFGKLVWEGSAYLIADLSMAEAIALGQDLGVTVLFAKAKTWRGSVLPCAGASSPINLEDASAVSRHLGNAYFDITGSGSSVLEMFIHSYGWNRILWFSRAWEDAPGGFVVKGHRYGFR